jgi:diaminopimelate decarboxylase
VQRLKELVLKLRAEGIHIRYLDLGGGLGITYQQEEPPHPREYAESLLREMAGIDCTLILEPGRVIVGNAGVLVTRVLYTKEGGEKNFVVVDAAMNDLIRPSLYGSYQRIQPVYKKETPEIVADVVGPICESGDFLAKDRKLSQMEPGELLAVMSAGAYGFSMASNYNSRPRAAEVLVAKDRFYIIREREDYDDLIKGEFIPDFLN